MPKKSKLKLIPLNLGTETLGQRIARFRKAKGLTQIALANKIGITQSLITDYEKDKLRPHPEMLIRFTMALEVSADELLGLTKMKNNGDKLNLRILRRLEKIENIPPFKQKVLLTTIDTFLKGVECQSEP